MSIENWLRKNTKSLQRIYDFAPYPIKILTTSMRGLVLSNIRYSTGFWNYLKGIEDREVWTMDSMLDFQNEKLKEIIRLAYETTIYFRQCFDNIGLKLEDIENLEDLKKIPILTREVVQKESENLISSHVAKKDRIYHRTSGTTGSGLNVVVDKSALQMINAFIARQMRWAGISPRDWRITMFGARVIPPSIDHPPYWVKNYPGRQIMLSGFHLSEKSINDYYGFLQKHQDLPIEGFASILHILSELLLKNNKKLKMKAIFSNGEPLLPHMRALIEDRLGAKIWDAYGQTELVGLIQECEMGSFHLAPDFGILEILDEEGNSVKPGNPGFFVWTGLSNKAMPLIRYRIGDIGEWQINQKCLCGRNTPLVNPVITRDSDYLYAPDGKIYSPRMVNQVLKDTDFKFCQFVQASKNRWIIRYISDNASGEQQARVVQKNLIKILGNSVELELERAEKPIQRQGGKVPLIIKMD